MVIDTDTVEIWKCHWPTNQPTDGLTGVGAYPLWMDVAPLCYRWIGWDKIGMWLDFWRGSEKNQQKKFKTKKKSKTNLKNKNFNQKKIKNKKQQNKI